jgi:hypothetical protein
MSAVAGWLAGVLLAVAIGQAADLNGNVTGLFAAGLSLTGIILGRIADRLAPR